MTQYTHYPLGREVRAAAGYYVIEAERVVPFEGRDVLVATGYMNVDNACCGAGGCGFALVPGYVLRWQSSTNSVGDPVSEVEPVRDPAEMASLRNIIQGSESVQQVNFL